MAEKKVGVRLSVENGDKAKEDMRSFGREGAVAMQKIQKATEPASAGLKVLNAAVDDINGRMVGVAGHAGTAASALSALGPVGGVAAAAIGAVALALGKGLIDSAEAEKVTQRLNAVLEATGFAAGITSDQLDQFADKMENSTLVTAEAVKSAAAVLATFRSVSGDTFMRTLSLAQDLAATFGGDLSSSATQLGKALEDPVNGVSALARVGVTFSSSQKDVIKSLVDTGKQAEAQKLILDVLAQQVGGAGGREADSLAGAFKRAGDAIGNFLEEIAGITGAAPGARAALESIADGINKVTVNALGAGSAGLKSIVAMKELATAQKELQQAQEQANATGLKEDFDTVAAWEKRVEELKAKVEAVAAEARAADTQTDAAAKGAVAAATQAATAAATAQQTAAEKALEGLATTEEKIKTLRDDLSKFVEGLNAMRAAGADAAVVDAAIATKTEATKRAIAELEKPGREAAEKASEQTKNLIDDLTTSINLFGNAREEFVRKYVDKLGENASPAEIARVKELAGALYDKTAAEKAATKASDAGKQVTEEVRTATEKYAARLAELEKLLRDGAISQETFARATQKAREEMEEHATDAISGARRALRSYSAEASNAAKQMEDAISGAFKGAEDALAEFVVTGKADFTDLANSILKDLARIAIQQGITGPLSSALGSVFSGGGGPAPVLTGSGWTTGIFHSGGRAGESRSETRELPAALWGAAPRAHTGARLLRPGEVPIIAEEGERILNRQETRAYEGGGVRNLLAARAQKVSDRLEMTVNLAGATGNREIEALVRAAVQQALDVYDRTRARTTAVDAVGASRSRTSVAFLR